MPDRGSLSAAEARSLRWHRRVAQGAWVVFYVAAVAAMDRVCRVAEHEDEMVHPRERREASFKRVDEAIAMAVMYVANHLPVKAIVAPPASAAKAESAAGGSPGLVLLRGLGG